MSDEPIRGIFKFNEVTRKMEPYDPNAGKKDVDAPFVITDEIEPTLSHANEQIYTSKRALRADYKALGFVEVGGEKPKPFVAQRPSYESIRDSVAKALNDVRYGNAPLSEMEKERCLREKREYQAYKERMERR